jgi:hypothetical protein
MVSLGCARSARRAHHKNYKLKKGISRLLNTLEERLCRGRHTENKIVEDFVRAQVGVYQASARSDQNLDQGSNFSSKINVLRIASK